MAGLTDHYSLPYPQGTDDAAIASDIQALAVSVDSSVYTVDQSLSATEASLTNQINALKTNVRYTVGSVVAEAGDFIVCDSASLINVTLPVLPQEDDIIRIYRNGNGAVSISGTGSINGPTLITSKNSGIIATFTGGEWWCLPLSFSESGGGYTPSPAWDRPSDWIDLPITIDSNTNGAYFLIHIPQNETVNIGFYFDSNTVAGINYYVDWGDGSTETVVSSVGGTNAYHTYLWSNLSGATQLDDNSRQAYILIEPVSPTGQLNAIYPVNSTGANLVGYIKEYVSALKYADYVFCPYAAQNLIVYTRGRNLSMDYMTEETHDIRKATIYCEGGTPYLRRAFYFASKLESANIFGTTGINVDMDSCFAGCYSLKSVYIDSGIYMSDISYMFEDSGITQAVNFNINGRNPFDSWGTYYYSSLKSIDGDSITNSQYAQGLYAYAYALEYASNINLSNNFSVEDTFSDCINLKEVKNINFSNSLSTREAFRNCYTLKKIDGLTVSGTQNTQSMFSSCYALSSIVNSSINLSSTSNASSMFAYCYSLEELPSLGSTTNITTATSMFQGAVSLKSLPSLNLSGVTSAANFASGCINLSWSDVYGMQASHTYANCNLSSAALNNIYTNLPISTSPPVVYFTNAYVYSSNYIMFTTAVPHNVGGTNISTFGFSNTNYNVTNLYAYNYDTYNFYVYRGYNAGSPGTLGYMQNASYGTITVTGNPGVAGDNPSIAISKGWTVVG